MSAIYEVNLKNPVVEQGWRGLAWSPMGCTSSGGCLLAGLSSDFKVRVLCPPVSALSSTWQESADVTALLQRTMAERGWTEIDCHAVEVGALAAGGDDAALRLRGGCSRWGGGSGVSAADRRRAPDAAGPGAGVVAGAPGGRRVATGGEAEGVLRLRGGARTKRRPAEPSGKAAEAGGADAPGSPGAQEDATVAGAPVMAAAGADAAATAAVNGSAAGGSGGSLGLVGIKMEPQDAAGGGGCAAEGTAVGAAETPAAAAAADKPEGDEGGPPASKRQRLSGAAGPGSGAGAGSGAGSGSWRLAGIRPGVARVPAAAGGGAQGVARGAQLREGDPVEAHNAEDGLMGGWFPGRLLRLSPPQYGYGLVRYDDLQVSEEPGSAYLTEWFPLPGCPRLLTAAAARTALPPGPDGRALPVHCRRGYSVRPVPPSQLAASPVPPPLRLGVEIEVYHEGAWWAAKLMEVTGPREDVEAAATVGRGVAAAAAAIDGTASTSIAPACTATVAVRVELLDASDEVSVPLERTRAAVHWDERTASWSVAPGAVAVSTRPPHFRDVVLLTGGDAAAAVLEPLFVQRVEALRAAGVADDEDGLQEGEGESWAAAVEEAGKEMLRAFAPEFWLLQLDGAWLWEAVQGSLAGLQGASSGDQLQRPAWALAPRHQPPQQQPKKEDGPEEAGAAAEGATAAVLGASPGKKAAGGGGGGATRRGRPGSAAAGADGAPLDFAGIDPATFHPYDKRPDREEGGQSLEKLATGMVAGRFSALLAAAHPDTVHTYTTGERITGTELRLYEQSYGEFMHLYGSKLPEGAAKRLSTTCRARCRLLVRTAPKAAATPGPGGDEGEGGGQEGAGAGEKSRGKAAKRRRMTGADVAVAEGGEAGGSGEGAAPAKVKDEQQEAAAAVVVGSPRKKASATPGAGGAPRRGRASAAAAAEPDVPPPDYSGTDPATFHQYDIRPDKEEGGLSLERAGAAMVVGRFFGLKAVADPAAFRAYAPGERLAGMELKLVEQAYGEFIHLYGTKLPHGADQRLKTEAKRRIRQRLPVAALPTPDGDGDGDGGSEAEKQEPAGGATATNASGRRARAAAVRAAAATRKQVAGGGEEEDDEEGGGGGGGGPGGGPSAAKGAGRGRGRGRGAGGRGAGVRKSRGGGSEDEEGAGADDTSDFDVDEEAGEESGSGEASLEEEEGEEDDGEEEEEGGGDEVESEAEPAGEGGRRGGRGGGGGTGRGRGGTGRGRGGGASARSRKAATKEEEAAAVASAAPAIDIATVDLFSRIAPALMNWEDVASLQKNGPNIIYRRFLHLRSMYPPSQLHSYTRGEHLRGCDLAAFLQAYGEYIKVSGNRLSSEQEKKLRMAAKAVIRRQVIQSAPYGANALGGLWSVAAGGPGADAKGTGQIWTGKRRLGVREAAGIQGTLFMGYGEGAADGEGAGAAEADEEEPSAGGAGGGGATSSQQQPSQQQQAGSAAAGGDGGEGPAPKAPRETWKMTLACIGRRAAPRYSVQLTRGSGGAGKGHRAEPGPSYSIRFHGMPRDDHRTQSLQQCRAEVGSGPPVSTPAYEARSLAIMATCVAWSPTFVTRGATETTATAAATAQTANGGHASSGAAPPPASPDGVPRSCVLTVGNKLGQVALWRLDLPAAYSAKSPQAGMGGAKAGGGAGGGGGGNKTPSPLELQWMGALRVHWGGAYVLRTMWAVAPEGAAVEGREAEEQEEQEGAAAAEAESAGEGAKASEEEAWRRSAWRQWRVPQPHSAGPRDSLLLLTGLSDGSILLWSVPSAAFRHADDLALIARLCPPDGLAPTSLDCTWLLHQPGQASAATAIPPTSAATATPGSSGADSAAAQPSAEGKQPQAQAGIRGTDGMQVEAAGTVGGGGEGGETAQRARVGGGSGSNSREDGDAMEVDRAAAGEGVAAASGGVGKPEASPSDVTGGTTAAEARAAMPSVAGPAWRQLLVVSSKPCGALFVWRSGAWRPASCGATTGRQSGSSGGGTDHPDKEGKQEQQERVEAEEEAEVEVTADLADACTKAGGAVSCLLPGAHGTNHASGVALAAGRPLVVSGGLDGTLRSWTIAELTLPPLPGPAAERRRRRPWALTLVEVPEGLFRLDPSAAGGTLAALPRQVRTLPQSRQGVYGIAPSGNGLVFAVLRTTSSRQLDLSRNIMIHGRVLGGTVHLMTPYDMDKETAAATVAAAATAAAAAAAAAAPAPAAPSLSLPSPGELAAGLLFQAPTAAGLWDLHVLALRAGLVAASRLPPVPDDVWTELGEATAADDAAVLEQVQGTEEGGNAEEGAAGGGGSGAGAAGANGNMDLGRARLAALVRRDTEERRRAKLITRLQHLTAAAVMAAALDVFVRPLEASYLAAAAKCAAAAEAALDSDSSSSIYATMGGDLAWGWCGLRCASALRRMALSYAASIRSDIPGVTPHDILAEVDAGVVVALRQAGGAGAAAAAAPVVLAISREAAIRNEVELLQAHVWNTLTYSIAYCTTYSIEEAAVQGAVQTLPLYRLLMSDWVAAHVNDPRLRAEMLPLAAVVYCETSEDPPLDCTPPGREAVSLVPGRSVGLSRRAGLMESAAMAEICLDGGADGSGGGAGRSDGGAGAGAAAAKAAGVRAAGALPAESKAAAGPSGAGAAAADGDVAVVGSEGGDGGAAADRAAAGVAEGGNRAEGGGGGVTIQLPRCGATFVVCGVMAGVWNCMVCDRRYCHPPTLRPLQPASPPAPFCLFCGVRLGCGSLGDNFLRQPSLPAGSLPGGGLLGG